MSKIEIKKIGIISNPSNAIVNAANDSLAAGGGVCGVIFRAAGVSQLQAACNAIGHTPTGSAAITDSFGLSNVCKFIIHAVGPIWGGGNDNEDKLLYSAYKQSLILAQENNCHTISLPLISSGIYGYPLDGAWRKALQSCNDFIVSNPDYDIDITFCIIDDDKYDAGLRIRKELNI